MDDVAAQTAGSKRKRSIRFRVRKPMIGQSTVTHSASKPAALMRSADASKESNGWSCAMRAADGAAAATCSQEWLPTSGTMDAIPVAALARATARWPSLANSLSPPNGAVSTGTDSGMPRNSVLVFGSPTPVIGFGLITQRVNASRLARSVCSVPAPLSR